MRAWWAIAAVAAACSSGHPQTPADANAPGDALPADAPTADACVPRTCDSSFAYCGSADDGCGGTLACGDCPAALTCGAREPNVCGVAAADRACNPAGWCWEHPLPFGMDLASTWAVAADDLWAAGSGGTLLRSSGTTWRATASGTDVDLTAMWGTTTSDLWIVGSPGYVRHWNGTTLASSPGAPTDLYATAVHGSSANDVWVAGAFGAEDFSHFNGSAWTSAHNPDFFQPAAVYAASPTQAWAFGFGDTALQWNGTTWSQIAGFPQTNYGVFGTSASNLWVAGDDHVEHWNGSAWADVPLPVLADNQLAIDGTSATDVWTGGETGLYHYDGAAWTRTPTDATIASLRVLGPASAWAAGRSGRTLQWDGTAWTKRTGFGVAYSLEAIWPVSDSELWFVGAGLLRWRDGQLTDYGAAFPSLEWYDIAGAWGSRASDIWVVGPRGRFVHWDGAAWTASTPIAMLPDLTAVWGAAADDVYAVTRAIDPSKPSDASVVHWDGAAWTVVTTIHEGAMFGVDLHAVGGTGAADVWVGGDDGTLFHWDGAAWTSAPLATAGNINQIWTTPTGTLLLATDTGVYRRTGQTWTQLAGLTDSVGSVTGSDRDLWVTLGTVLNPTPLIAHYDGTTWTRENTGAGQAIRRLAMTSDSLFAAGRSGGILRKAR